MAQPKFTNLPSANNIILFLSGNVISRVALPKYEVGSITGPDHNQTFTISCSVETLKKAEIAQGHSKQDAEQTAAKKILEALKKEIK